MRKTVEIVNEIAKKTSFLREMTSDEARLLKATLLGMYCDLYKLCEKHNIPLLMLYGSALGAVRHQGFIPWDDDIDLGVKREDYERLKDLLLAGELGDKYSFTFPSKDKDSKNYFMKIYLKESYFAELADLGSPFPKGIFLDVFPIERVPKSKFVRSIKGRFADLVGLMSTFVLYSEYPTTEMNKFMSQTKDGRRRWRLYKLIGGIGRFMKHRKWIWLLDRLMTSTKSSDLYSLVSTSDHYKRVYKAEELFPGKQLLFEGQKVCVPQDVEKHLVMEYGTTYMELPPPEKRLKHLIVDVKFPAK